MGLDPLVHVPEAVVDRFQCAEQFVALFGRLAEDGAEEVRTGTGDGGLHDLDLAADRVAGRLREPRGVLLDRAQQVIQTHLVVVDHLGDFGAALAHGFGQPCLDGDVAQLVLKFFHGDFALVGDLEERITNVVDRRLGEARGVGHVGHKPLEVTGIGRQSPCGHGERLIELERGVEHDPVDGLHHRADVHGLFSSRGKRAVQVVQAVLGRVEGLVPLEAFEQRVARRAQ